MAIRSSRGSTATECSRGVAGIITRAPTCIAAWTQVSIEDTCVVCWIVALATAKEFTSWTTTTRRWNTRNNGLCWFWCWSWD